MAFTLNSSRTKLAKKLRKNSWYLSSGIGLAENQQVIRVNVKDNIPDEELKMLPKTFYGHPVNVVKIKRSTEVVAQRGGTPRE